VRALLDTHGFVWMNDDDPRLSTRARDLMRDTDVRLDLSLASVWELAIKSGLGRLRLPLPVHEYVPARIRAQSLTLLEIRMDHVLRVASLPPIHNDPFDRLLIAQAMVEGVPILTADPQIARYDVETIW
jgi:PIN domain nuclease of toxin-antitoxin system